ncbi:DJ-1/PfpI family protein [Caldinitratiruptor microaerophilus]|uniref:Protease n=1 Tax=Caldinitratiruptor microaerophilus TaxID=671077 RepID=A0AA35CJN6_9FIRM|nr:DJ-1/PfpI family protein [Caldinitratiruptor microaerophilus]BDG60510.1 protease [Caldinitratiruptor microaerophilus]
MKVLLMAGDGAEALETMYPLQRLREEGFEVHVAAPRKKVLQTVVHDFEPDMETYTEKPGYRVQADLGFLEVRPADYDALYLVGGRAPEWIRNEPGALEIVRHFFENQKPVGAICHAALVLVAAGVVKGRKMAAYWALKPDVEAAGGTFVDQEAVVDGNLVSARAWPDHPALLREFVRMVRGERVPV